MSKTLRFIVAVDIAPKLVSFQKDVPVIRIVVGEGSNTESLDKDDRKVKSGSRNAKSGEKMAAEKRKFELINTKDKQ